MVPGGRGGLGVVHDEVRHTTAAGGDGHKVWVPKKLIESRDQPCSHNESIVG